MKKRSWLLICCAIAVAACSAPARVVKLDQSPSVEGKTYSKILVVGVHADRMLRRSFEQSVAKSLTTRQVAAVASTAVMGADTPLDRDSLVAAAHQTNADAVLITRLVDVQRRSELEAGRTTARAVRRDDVPLVDFFRYDYVEHQDPMTMRTVMTVIVSSDLYDVATEGRVWSVESTAFDKETVYDVLDTLSSGIAKQLGRDGLVR